MNEEVSCLSFPSWLFSSWRSLRAPRESTAPSAPGSARSSSSATRKSATFAARPSFYVLTAASCLLVSGALALVREPAEQGSGEAAGLLAHGWQLSERLPCPGAKAGLFFEIEGENSVVEAFSLSAERSLVSRLPFPEPVLQCREIPGPHFVQEIE